MDPTHLHDFVIAPVLDHLETDSLAARRLMLGTALTESRLVYLRQKASGPALGIYQMEPTTHDDIWENYLEFNPDMANRVRALRESWPGGPTSMVGNLWYATAMARLKYWRKPNPLPDAGSPERMAEYHKRHYNTALGAATVTASLPHFREAVRVVEE